MHKSQKDTLYYFTLVQKILVFALFFLMIGVLIYSLIYMTPFYDIYKIQGTMKFSAMESINNSGFERSVYLEKYQAEAGAALDPFGYNILSGQINGLNLEYFTAFTRENGMQVFNHWMFNVAVLGIVLSAFLFIYRCQLRKRYYVTNFVTIGVVTAFDFYVGFSLISKLAYWANYIATKVDYLVLNLWYSDDIMSEEYVTYYSASNANWIFTLGYIIAVALIVAAGLSLAGAIYKFIYQRKHEAIDISGVKVDE